VNAQSALGQLKSLWDGMPRWQRISIPAVALAVVAGLLGFSRLRHEGDFKPLFTGMSSEDAGSIVQKLKESGTEYRVGEDGATVMVPSAKVAETRLQLAAAGLPRTGRLGFELFDQTKLGATDFAEQVNYRRALEGELERSIRSVAEVEQARVHLTFPKDSVFLESKQPAKASVLLQLRGGTQVEPATVTAISHLIASAVEGLAPDAVSIMDAQGNLLNKPKKALAEGEVSDEALEYRRKLEKDMLDKVDATLEPLLGAGRYRVMLSVDCDFASGEQSEELYDPEKSVMLTSQKTEESGGSVPAGGVPGTAANLPRATTRQSGGTSVTKRTENISFQSSRTIRKLRLPQGNIRRISASVLLDQGVEWQTENGQPRRVLVPPSPESLRVIRELVAGAIGLVPTRGDQLVLESLPFDSTLRVPPPAAPAAKQQPRPSAQPAPADALQWLQDWRILGAAAAGLLLIAAAFWMWLRKRGKRRKPAPPTLPQALPSSTNRDMQAVAGAAAAAVAPSDATSRMLAEAEERVQASASVETLVSKLRHTIAEDPAIAASVLRTWLEDSE
jgi:flagellar M-ring protein FliF